MAKTRAKNSNNTQVEVKPPEELVENEHLKQRMLGTIGSQVLNPTKKSQYLLDMLTLPKHK